MTSKGNKTQYGRNSEGKDFCIKLKSKDISQFSVDASKSKTANKENIEQGIKKPKQACVYPTPYEFVSQIQLINLNGKA